MNRRDFLKSALTIAALAPMEKVFSATETGETMNTKTNSTKPQVTRRPYRGTDLTLPLLGFGMMRLPQKDGKVDYAVGEKMVAKAMESGCNYFDTAYMYHDGESEKFAGAVLSQYKRDSYFLTDKMPIVMIHTTEPPCIPAQRRLTPSSAKMVICLSAPAARQPAPRSDSTAKFTSKSAV